MKPHIEKAFETSIEDHLLQNGYQKGNQTTFDHSKALDPGGLIAFIKETQSRDWTYIEPQLHHSQDTLSLFIECPLSKEE